MEVPAEGRIEIIAIEMIDRLLIDASRVGVPVGHKSLRRPVAGEVQGRERRELDQGETDQNGREHQTRPPASGWRWRSRRVHPATGDRGSRRAIMPRQPGAGRAGRWPRSTINPDPGRWLLPGTPSARRRTGSPRTASPTTVAADRSRARRRRRPASVATCAGSGPAGAAGRAPIPGPGRAPARTGPGGKYSNSMRRRRSGAKSSSSVSTRGTTPRSAPRRSARSRTLARCSGSSPTATTTITRRASPASANGISGPDGSWIGGRSLRTAGQGAAASSLSVSARAGPGPRAGDREA